MSYFFPRNENYININRINILDIKKHILRIYLPYSQNFL